MGKAQTLQAMGNRNRQQQQHQQPGTGITGRNQLSIKATASSESLLGAGGKVTPRGRESPFGKLPDIQGVSKLSRSEVRKDLDEIEMLITGVPLSELDDIKVLSSFYPVKPRLELKIPEHLKAAQRAVVAQQQQLAAEAEATDVGDLPFVELLEFLRLVEIVRPDILDAERERERLESKYMSIRDNFIAETLRQSSNNKQRFNYLRALQVLLCRKVAKYGHFGHHVSMLSDLLTSLEEKGVAIGLLEQATKSIGSTQSAMQEHPATAYKVSTPDVVSSVAIKRSNGEAVLLHAGMRVDTPFGAGVIRAIRVTGIKAVEIDLPFGVLYASPAETVQWFTFVNDDSCVSAAEKSEKKAAHSESKRYLFHRWQDERRGIFLPMDVQANIISHKDVVSRIELANSVAKELRRKTWSDSDDARAIVDSSQPFSEAELAGEEEADIEMKVEQAHDNVLENLKVRSAPVLTKSANGLIDADARDVVSEVLPYLFLSSDSVVEVSEKIAATRSQRRVWKHALIPQIPPAHIGKLQMKLKDIQSQLDALKEEKLRYENSISVGGKSGAKITQEAALTRLSMFTRRVRRRTMLPIAADSFSPAPINVPKIQAGEASDEHVTNNKENGSSAKSSPQQKHSDSGKRGSKRGTSSTPQKPVQEESAETSPSSSVGATGRGRSLRGSTVSAPAVDKPEATTGRGGSKRKLAGSGFDEDGPEVEQDPQEPAVVTTAASITTGAPRSKRSRKI